MNDFWTASVTPGGRGPSNETWQNGDICRNIGYSLRLRHLSLSLSLLLSLSLAAHVLIVYDHWSIYFNWHFLPGPGVLNLAGVIYILLLIKKRKKKQNLAVTVQAMVQRHFIKRRCDRRSTELCLCVKERDMRLVEKTTVSGIESQRKREKLCISSVISHLPHREKSQYLINLLIWMMSSAV